MGSLPHLLEREFYCLFFFYLFIMIYIIYWRWGSLFFYRVAKFFNLAKKIAILEAFGRWCRERELESGDCKVLLVWSESRLSIQLGGRDLRADRPASLSLPHRDSSPASRWEAPLLGMGLCLWTASTPPRRRWWRGGRRSRLTTSFLTGHGSPAARWGRRLRFLLNVFFLSLVVSPSFSASICISFQIGLCTYWRICLFSCR